MNAIFMLMALVSGLYQVFATAHDYYSVDARDRWANGVWGESTFYIRLESSWDDISNITSPETYTVEFDYPLCTGRGWEDLWFEKGVTYDVRLGVGEWFQYQVFIIEQWWPVDAITVPTVPTEEWFDTIEPNAPPYLDISVSWKLIDDETLRFRVEEQSSNYEHVFIVFPIPDSQDLGPTTWGSIKSSF